MKRDVSKYYRGGVCGFLCLASVCVFVVTRKMLTAGGIDVCIVILGNPERQPPSQKPCLLLLEFFLTFRAFSQIKDFETVELILCL